MLTGNKGEWSEIYALFKLLGDKELYPGNSEIEKLQNLVYPIIKILRSENNGDFEQAIDYLRKKGAKVAANRGDRESKEGAERHFPC